MPVHSRKRLLLVLPLLLAVLTPVLATAQDDPNDIPLGDVARNLRKKNPQPDQPVIDDDNLSQIMREADSRRVFGASLRYMMAGETKGFQISSPDVTCSLSFSPNVKSLLASSQYAQMDLPAGDVAKLAGPATIEGDTLSVSLQNGTNWHLSEISVVLTILKKKTRPDLSLTPGSPILPDALGSLAEESQVRPEKSQDTVLIYRMRAAAPPWSRALFSAPLNLDLAPSDEWHWAIVEAKGYPPNDAATAAREKDSSPPVVQATIPASLTEPQDSTGNETAEGPR